MHATTTIIMGLTLIVRLTSAVPTSSGTLQARAFEDECGTNEDCGEHKQCVKIGGGPVTLFGGMPEHTVCQYQEGYNECQTDADCGGDSPVCRLIGGPDGNKLCQGA
ncbi:hypothetical protein LIA77_06082 [Sarocladium implicatum]|nr:hypothetical protein LIA77_06082 [Sarocladium implicatum]